MRTGGLRMEELLAQLMENKDNEEVQNALLGIVPVEKVLETEHAQKAIQPLLDKRATQAIETWKNNHLETEISKAIDSRGLVETAEQKRLREMEERIAKMDRERQQATIKAQAIEKLSEKGLPTSFAGMVLGDTIEVVNNNINELEYEFSKAVNGGVTNTLGKNGHEPRQPEGGVTPPTKKPVDAYSYEEMLDMKNNNPKMYAEVFGE